MKTKTLTILLTLSVIIGIGVNLQQKAVSHETISNLESKIETKSTEIARLENVIENQNEKLEEKQMVIEKQKEEIGSLNDRVEVHKEKIEELKKNQATIKTTSSKPLPSRGKSYQTMEVVATAYVALCDTGCIGITKGGTNVKNTIYHATGHRIIAVDPNVIPLGSLVKIGNEIFIADDTGGKIKGRKIDILVKTVNEANQWGKKTITVEILRKGW
ncbi:cell wall-binding protein precursor [Bacillus phage vB_BcoS-136]|uniref:Cell wall-binding protein n=1 Tax=Bacillus phage vB_BcoS-136 TaxID=2419619 RepID=A0A3G3BVS5_9CAUD|nr:cell wall-binding protein precursor [Bacillus phage vB_BcoS-136]AYP68365.1 cell wall-binding protein precursor [Bacillus phage vB_BcoS-136]